MARIITAIPEEKILKKIIKSEIVIEKNIIYKEAILDMLKKNINIDIIIISEKIPGDIDFIRLIKKIRNRNKKIKIIIILYNKKIEKDLRKNKIEEIYYNNIISIFKLIKKLKGKENNHLKNRIKNNIKNNKTINKIINKIINNIKFNKKKENNIICIFGKDKINKKIIELIIIKKLLIENKKIIIFN